MTDPTAFVVVVLNGTSVRKKERNKVDCFRKPVKLRFVCYISGHEKGIGTLVGKKDSTSTNKING
jgi:transcription elongation factor Elf1